MQRETRFRETSVCSKVVSLPLMFATAGCGRYDEFTATQCGGTFSDSQYGRSASCMRALSDLGPVASSKYVHVPCLLVSEE